MLFEPFLLDPRGSVKQSIDGNQLVEEEQEYTAFGAPVNGVKHLKEKFLSVEPLDDGNLYLLGSRLYRADIGRFLQPDPVLEVVPFALSPYSYANNSPIDNNDASGLFPQSNEPDYEETFGYARKLREETKEVANRFSEDLGHPDRFAEMGRSFREGENFRRGWSEYRMNEREMAQRSMPAVNPGGSSIGNSGWRSGLFNIADWPTIPKSYSNLFVGFGDGVSLGITVGIRGLLNTNELVDFRSVSYGVGVFSGIAWTSAGYSLGAELSIGRNFRFAPWGNRTGSGTGELPHYHRRGSPDGYGKTPDGQGIGRHRPWDTRVSDTTILDRF